jgi:rod shape determining protein RodA
MSVAARTPIVDPTQPEGVAVPRRTGLPFDGVLLLAVLGICAASLITLHGATKDDPNVTPNFYVTRQAVYFGVGMLLAAGLARLDYSRLRELKYGLYAVLIGTILLVSALGSVARGSRRAIALPFFSFQASELGKVLLILALSAFVVDRIRRLQERDTTARVMLAALVPAALVMAQPDLGSALVYLVVVLAVLYIAGTTWRHFAALFALGGVAIALVLVAAPAAGVTVLHSYQKDRLTAFLHPTDNPAKQGYQQNQSKIAIGAGQRTGRGNQATQTRLNFLPEHHTDFIFAVVGTHPVALRADDLAWPSNTHPGEEPLRRAGRRRHRRDADVPGIRQRRDDRRDRADHRHPAAAHELWRQFGHHNPSGPWPPAVDLRAGPGRRGTQGPRTHLLRGLSF